MHVSDLERSLFASIELSPIATVITNPHLPDNPIVCANTAFIRLTGYPKEEILGRNCRFLGGPDTEPERRAALATAIALGQPVLTVLRNYRKDGTSFRNAVMIAPVRAADGSVNYFLGSQMDVSGEATPLPRERMQHAAGLVAALTRRQHQVLELMLAGHRNKQIAAMLGIEEKTVKMHRASLLRRLGAATSADAIRIGLEARGAG